MRGSRTTSNLILAGTLGFGSLIALAAPAMAETPAQEGAEMVLVLGGGDTDPQGPQDLAPVPTPDPEDGFEGPDDLTSDPGCAWAHNCLDEDPTPDGHCFDDAGAVIDPSECIPTDDGDQPDSSTDTDASGSSTDRGALPRTGAGVVALALAGGALTGVGAALRKVAKR